MMNLEKKNKPQTARRIICLAMITIMMMGVSGCTRTIEQTGSDMYSQIDQYTEESRQLMLEYMEEKYGEEFTLVPSVVTFFPETPHGCSMYPVSHPDWYVNVNYSPGTEQPFSDNYVAFLKMDEVRDYLKPYFDEVYGAECRLFVNKPSNAVVPGNISRDTSIETYLSVVTVSMNIFTTADNTSRDIDARKIWDLEVFIPYSMVVGVCYLTQEGFASEEAINGTVNSEFPYLYWGHIKIYRGLRDEGYIEVNWREGSALNTSTSQT